MDIKPRGYWTKERCYEEAKKYNTRTEFQNGSKGAYLSALRKGWLDEVQPSNRTIKQRSYWDNKENCFNEGNKYKTRVDFKKNNTSAYNSARRNGWLDELFPNAKKIKPKGYWTKERCYEEAKKYKTRVDFQKGNGGAYNAAQNNNWLDDYNWLEEKHKPNGYWTKERCYEEAKKYTSRGDFSKGSEVAYLVSKNNKWLDDYDWFERKNNPYRNNIHNVYAYIFEDFHAVYIGLTDNLKRRKTQHNKDINSQVHKFAEEHNIPIPQMTILEENVSMNASLIKEDFYVNKYKEEGWNVLNVGRTGIGCGSLGGCIHKWTKKICFEEAKKYNTRTEFAKGNASAYKVALKHGWLDDYDWMKPIIKPNGYWTYERCYEEAKKYHSRSGLRNNNGSAYAATLKHGWINEFFPIINKAV